MAFQTLWSGDHFQPVTAHSGRPKSRKSLAETLQGILPWHDALRASTHVERDFRNLSKRSMELIMVFRNTLTIFSPSIGIAPIFPVVWAGSIRHGMNLSIRKQ
jgi:hypothetical protein